MKSLVIRKDDVLYSSEASIGKIGLANYISLAARSVTVVQPNNLIKSSYLLNLLIANKKQIEKIVFHNAILRIIRLTEFRNINFKIPKIPEQKKIESFLNKYYMIVNWINELKRSIIVEKEQLLYQLFVSKIKFNTKNKNYPFLRFPKFNDKYKEYKLSDLSIKIFGGSTPKTKNKKYWKNGKYNFIRTKDLYKDDDFYTKYITTTEKYVNEKALDKMKSLVIRKDDVLYSSVASIGRIGLANYISLAGSWSVTVVQPNNLIKSSYLLNLLIANKKQIEKIVTHNVSF